MDTQLELLKEKWDKILESIRDDNELSNVAFKTWLLPLKVFRIEVQMQQTIVNHFLKLRI